ncbi:hypothetical protein HY251_11085 [bacterium]|nr:hypothetical protein [bacterium]
MTSIEHALRDDNEATRRALYEGAILRLPPTPASSEAVSAALSLLEDELGPEPRAVQAALSNDEFFRKIGRIRKRLHLEDRFHDLVLRVVAALGFEPGEVAFDPLRLRVVAHRGHENPLAAPVYYPHRDTWYAHPQSLIAWWIPLHDLPEEETFVFFPDCFQRAVPNDSHVFDYDAWVREGFGLKIGWQDLEAGKKARYPGATGPLDPGRAVGFSCRAGENLLFSGAHFHETRRHAAGRTRFSLDFRLVHLEDERSGRGAPNVDNRSRGSALADYVRSARRSC